MKKILVYSSNICPYCIAAKNLLSNLNLTFEEILVARTVISYDACRFIQKTPNTS